MQQGRKPRRITARQKRFVEEYLIDLNATQAALRAGYSRKDATNTGYRLLRKTPEVAEAIEGAQAERAERMAVTADRVVIELAKIAFGNPRRLFALGKQGVVLRNGDELTDAEAALISEITKTGIGDKRTRRVKLYCKMTALTALGRHLGLFNGKPKAGGEGAAAEGHESEAATEGENAREVLARRIAELAARLGTDGSPVAPERG